MARIHTITGIDIGNTQVKVVIAKIDRDMPRPEIIGYGRSPSHGLRKGTVTDMEETIKSIRSAVAQAQTMAGVSVSRTLLSVGGQHISVQASRGVIAVSRADNEISQSDIERVIQAASTIGLPPNREVIDIIPRNFIVDGTDSIKNPLGMKGVRLEAEVLIVDGLSPHLRNLAKCVNECGIEVSDLVYIPLAASYAALDKHQKEYGSMSLDFGGGVSSIAIFEEADLIHNIVLPVGSRHITNDLAIALRTSIDIAEQVKLQYASTVQGDDSRRREMLDLSHLMGDEQPAFSRKQLVRVVDARAQELLDMVSSELKKISKSGKLPAGVVLSGGGANLPGFMLAVKDRLNLPVRLARPVAIDGPPDIIEDPTFVVAVGLVLIGVEREERGTVSAGTLFSRGGKIGKKMTGWLKNFLP